MVRRQIHIRGIVQGVGFRPFVYNLARRFSLNGYVRNTSDGVLIEAEGDEWDLHGFESKLLAEPPPLAEIKDVAIVDASPAGDRSFTIRESVDEAGQFLLISPDVATCDDCVRDFTSPGNRRYGYPFTNCTNCGPRYTIVTDIPYDRPATTMAGFKMCAACQAEYDDPTNRRFHAQPNACPECGPSLSGSDLPRVRRLFHEGKIVAVKGLGGFHLACDAENDAAVRLLRERKRRSDKPFALMAPDTAAVETFAVVSAADREALLSPERPIVILPRRPGAKISAEVAPRNNTLGVMLPYTPLHYLLFGEPPEFTALVMTSGNLSEEPIVNRNEEAGPRLGPIADEFLLHNRDIYMRADDSVVRTFEGRPRVLRRSRGFTPRAIDLDRDLAQILACGAELKNTFCLTRERYALVSQHIGDLENYETLVFFKETLENMKKLFRITPVAVAYDLHPLYLSTKFALELEGVPKIGVQHHHAHIASCMAENGLNGRVIGVAFDGTGYGTDGQIWGGEFLVAGYAGFERRAHFAYVPLPGGDTAIREPWRMAVSYLRTVGQAFSHVSPQKVDLVNRMIDRGINTVQTSSCGRLFDAVASILGLRQEVNYEGQAAIELEMAAAEGIEGRYPFAIGEEIDVRPTLEAIVKEVQRAEPVGVISARFHNTIAAIILEACGRLRESEHLNRVCLSGGTFQNMYLLKRAVGGLRATGFEVFLHAKVPPNDGGISLGQAMVANEILKERG